MESSRRAAAAVRRRTLPDAAAGKIGGGDLAFYVSQGRLIEDGRLTTRTKDMNIMGNGPKMLQGVTMVANDLEIPSDLIDPMTGRATQQKRSFLAQTKGAADRERGVRAHRR